MLKLDSTNIFKIQLEISFFCLFCKIVSHRHFLNLLNSFKHKNRIVPVHFCSTSFLEIVPIQIVCESHTHNLISTR